MTDNPSPARPSTLERLLGDTEPVRRALYPVVVAVVALLVAYGLIDAETVPLWLALAVTVLGIGGTEAARAVAYAPATVADEAHAWQAALDDEYARGVADALERTPDQVAAEVLDDEPGEHAAPEAYDTGSPDEVGPGFVPMRTEPTGPATEYLERAELPTGLMRAPSRADRCREVDDGERCMLQRDHAGPHMIADAGGPRPMTTG